LAEVLRDDPDRERDHEAGREGGAAAPPVEGGEPDQRLGDDQRDDDRRSVVRRPTGDRRVESADPAGSALRYRTRDRCAGVLARKRLEDRRADPQHRPGERQPARGRFVRGIAPRPCRECEHAVEERGSGRAGQQARVAACEPG